MDKLNKLKSARSRIRRFFTKSLKDLEVQLTTVPLNGVAAKVEFEILRDKAERLFALDTEIQSLMLDGEDVQEDALDDECNDAEGYRNDWLRFRTRMEGLQLKTTCQDGTSGGTDGNGESTHVFRNFNLPKIDLIEFDGDVRNWIAFWGQFQKVHGDPNLPLEDKFQYLLQATKPGSSARQLIDSFPPSVDNYTKAVEQLKARFARDELLIQVYVRELLNLVLQQSANDICMPLAKLFDKLETHIRALETLGVGTQKYAAMLYPLVESSLPEDTLRAWERFRTTQRSQFLSSGSSSLTACTNNLQELLDVLRTEVESEQRITLARSGFTFPSDSAVENRKHGTSETPSYRTKDRPQKLPTASSIISTEAQCAIVLVTLAVVGRAAAAGAGDYDSARSSTNYATPSPSPFPGDSPYHSAEAKSYKDDDGRRSYDGPSHPRTGPGPKKLGPGPLPYPAVPLSYPQRFLPQGAVIGYLAYPQPLAAGYHGGLPLSDGAPGLLPSAAFSHIAYASPLALPYPSRPVSLGPGPGPYSSPYSGGPNYSPSHSNYK